MENGEWRIENSRVEDPGSRPSDQQGLDHDVVHDDVAHLGTRKKMMTGA